MQQVAHHQALLQSTQATWVEPTGRYGVMVCCPDQSARVVHRDPPGSLVWRAVIDPTLWSSLTKRMSSMHCG